MIVSKPTLVGMPQPKPIRRTPALTKKACRALVERHTAIATEELRKATLVEEPLAKRSFLTRARASVECALQFAELEEKVLR